MYYKSFEEAAEACPFGKAIGETVVYHDGRERKVDIVKRRHGDGQITYRGHNGIVIRKATAKEIDSCRKWKSYAS